MNTRVKSIVSGVVMLLPAFLSVSCPDVTTPCISGTDVRNVDDTDVPEWIKERILWDPGRTVGRFYVSDQDGSVLENPDYPSGKLVVIRVAPSDWPKNTAVTVSYINAIFFELNFFEPVPSKSVASYYAENSYGAFLCTSGGVPEWVNLVSLTYYGDVETSITFLLHILRAADVDWPALDTNGDNAISRAEAQIVILIPDGSMSSGFASTRYRTIGLAPTASGEWYDFGTRPIIYFSLKAESLSDAHVNPIRYHASVIHELHHAFFNLPDRYGSNTGTGMYDHMSRDRSWLHLTLFDKMKIGWVHPRIVNKHLETCLHFPASESEAAGLVLVPPEVLLDPEAPLEYWVVENRHRAYAEVGYDDDLPENGLAIWYVSEGTYSNGCDDVRLVNASLPDQDPDLYNNPGYGAFFTYVPDEPERLLMMSGGPWSFLYFRRVSNPGYQMTVEF